LGDIIKQLLKKINPDLKDINPLSSPTLFLAFDEAHAITEMITTHNIQWSQFSSLHQSLHATWLLPIWSLFLSTTGKLEQVAPADVLNYSNCSVQGQLTILMPFSALGFDLLTDVLCYMGVIPWIMFLH